MTPRTCTFSVPGRLSHIPTDVFISSNYRDPQNKEQPLLWKGIWDTGASTTCITQKIVNHLGLIPAGQKQISTANGKSIVNTYLVDVGLPNNVIVENIIVSCANLGEGLDVLIGMDIITLGDFAITNVNGKTMFSFRMPSICTIDFNQEKPYNEVL